MSNKLDRKLDLLQDCNDQGMPPREFMALFCKRCRNGGCVNSGWSESVWSDRMATQVNRLLTNPTFADSTDPNFRAIRSLEFRQIEEPLVIGGDPWSGPTIHLATPDRQTAQISEVDAAILALSKKVPPQVPPQVPPRVVPPRVIQVDPIAPPMEPAQPQPNVVARPTAAQPQPVETPRPPRENPRHYVVEQGQGREANTSFPSEGVMLDGSPPPSVNANPSGVDPWAPSPMSGPMKVAVGARVRMGGDPKK